ncbi:unnamed protein product [Zymoseptoria tritici ST99CH_1A5]|uniref:Casein kinase II beta 2 subunit n=3 Tax=Zymoseptoria tritici TaxID=1047171 RepID=A0A1X7RHH4_ZYMT9|nr:unnamed protein product [Zymoseptoria tritici ST99CH_3D7]SMR43226.1 unnamed protein product [Zymoseptoria tritici ST99CH_1E4]SMR45387.1 unnamed protein product [Zymoseptoria tritici ST99CH_3D1]SMY20546.1 unnamed protein product [Zymoseptoria tritici ST99CH_1A5]
MPPIPGMMQWHSLLARHAKNLKAALARASQALENHLAGQQQRAAQLEPILVRNTPKHPRHPLAKIRQTQSRWYSTARKSVDASIRNFTSSATRSGAKYDRASFPKSRTSYAIQQSSGRAPFASTLRPNLTGGALGRTAGGYALGGSGRVGGARFFSHSPASQAQVVQNVSQAVRAFFVSGQKAQFDGISNHGDKRFKAVTALQEETGRKMRSLPKATPGSWIEFQVNPTITALTPLTTVTGYSFTSTADESSHLNTDGLLNILSVDFSRALKDLAAVLNDLKRLSALGDLPLTYEGCNLRVHFPGCDAGSVERLCEELGVQRGVVVQDEAFDVFAGTEVALLFPFAPSDSSLCEESDGADFFYEKPKELCQRHLISLDDMLSDSRSEHYSTQSEGGYVDVLAEEENPWQSSNSGYHSIGSGSSYGPDRDTPLEYQGFEGIYRFMAELDSVRR